MAGLGEIVNQVSTAYASFNTAWAVFKLMSKPTAHVELSAGPYRPKQWDGLPANPAELVLIRPSITFFGAIDSGEDESASYFFDAIIKEEHTTSLRMTEHPVQTGANITDHAFVLPARVVLEIGMSDVMDSLVQGQFADWGTRSISAFQTLKKIQAARTLLNVTTHLHSYKNMLIEQIHTPHDYKTVTALRCMVSLKEIFMAVVEKIKISAIESVTDEVKLGDVQPIPVESDAPGSVLRQVSDKFEGASNDLSSQLEGVRQLPGEANAAVQSQVGMGLDNVAKYAADVNTELGNYAGDALGSVVGGTPDILDIANLAENTGAGLTDAITVSIPKISSVSDKALGALTEIASMRDGAANLTGNLYTQLRLLT